MIRRFCLGLLIALMPALAQAQGQDYVTDARTGCKVYEPNPPPGMAVTWTGPCVNGWAEGQGTLQWIRGHQTNALSYVGQMRKGLMNGRGVYTWTNGDRFEGVYVENERNGPGVYNWANGDRYQGNYQNSRRHGQGVMTWRDGTRYEGMFADGLPNGYGTKFVTDGRRFTGTWTNGCFRQGDQWSTAMTTAEKCGFR